MTKSYGFSQGSVIGQILFNIFPNDLSINKESFHTWRHDHIAVVAEDLAEVVCIVGGGHEERGALQSLLQEPLGSQEVRRAGYGSAQGGLEVRSCDNSYGNE